MSLYAIGDLHLHFGCAVKSREQLTDPLWRGHEERFAQACARTVRPQDTLLLAGDHSWAKNGTELEPDFAYLRALPGRKILLRGNHDRFWEASKTPALNRQYGGDFFFLQNNCARYRDVALAGTKGYTFEGPFFLDRRGRITGWDEEEREHARMLVAREAERLRTSLEAARKTGLRRCVIFLHYPPTDILEKRSAFTDLAEEYGAEQVLYAHCHGERRFHDSLEGMHRGVFYRLISGDCLRWTPVKVLD